MPPQIFLLLVVFLVSFGAAYMIFSRKHVKRELQKEQNQQNFLNKFVLMEEQLAALEKRLSNVETIVTDSKFEESSAKEAINLKSELIELKDIIKNMK
jgi:flagellar basal body-associated protein FliL